MSREMKCVKQINHLLGRWLSMIKTIDIDLLIREEGTISVDDLEKELGV